MRARGASVRRSSSSWSRRRAIPSGARWWWCRCAPISTAASPPTRGSAELLSASHVLVGPMDRDELARAIEQPAARAGLEVERGLVDALVSDVAGEPGGLPLLSTTLLELWRARDGRVLRYEQLPDERWRARRGRAAGGRRLQPARRERAADRAWPDAAARQRRGRGARPPPGAARASWSASTAPAPCWRS